MSKEYENVAVRVFSPILDQVLVELLRVYSKEEILEERLEENGPVHDAFNSIIPHFIKDDKVWDVFSCHPNVHAFELLVGKFPKSKRIPSQEELEEADRIIEDIDKTWDRPDRPSEGMENYELEMIEQTFSDHQLTCNNGCKFNKKSQMCSDGKKIWDKILKDCDRMIALYKEENADYEDLLSSDFLDKLFKLKDELGLKYSKEIYDDCRAE